MRVSHGRSEVCKLQGVPIPPPHAVSLWGQALREMLSGKDQGKVRVETALVASWQLKL